MNTVPSSMMIENITTMQPTTRLMSRMPVLSNLPRTLSMSHVSPNHHSIAPPTMLTYPTDISMGRLGTTKANCA